MLKETPWWAQSVQLMSTSSVRSFIRWYLDHNKEKNMTQNKTFLVGNSVAEKFAENFEAGFLLKTWPIYAFSKQNFTNFERSKFSRLHFGPWWWQNGWRACLTLWSLGVGSAQLTGDEALYQPKWRADVLMKFQNNRDSSLRTITNFVWQLGRYEHSSPPTKELNARSLCCNWTKRFQINE